MASITIRNLDDDVGDPSSQAGGRARPLDGRRSAVTISS